MDKNEEVEPSPWNVTDHKDGHNVEDDSGQVEFPVSSPAASTVKWKSKNYFFIRKLVGVVSQPSLDLAEGLEDDDVEGGEDDDGPQLSGDEGVDAVEGGVVPDNQGPAISTGK